MNLLKILQRLLRFKIARDSAPDVASVVKRVGLLNQMINANVFLISALSMGVTCHRKTQHPDQCKIANHVADHRHCFVSLATPVSKCQNENTPTFGAINGMSRSAITAALLLIHHQSAPY